MNLSTMGWVALGAGIGAPTRYVVDRLVTERSGSIRVPLGLLVVNIFGSAVLGFILGLDNQTLAIVVGSGFCGALTTFSGFVWESTALWRQQRAAFWVFIVFMTVLCIASFWIAWSVTSALV
jgi:CrcB protein